MLLGLVIVPVGLIFLVTGTVAYPSSNGVLDIRLLREQAQEILHLNTVLVLEDLGV